MQVYSPSPLGASIPALVELIRPHLSSPTELLQLSSVNKEWRAGVIVAEARRALAQLKSCLPVIKGNFTEDSIDYTMLCELEQDIKTKLPEADTLWTLKKCTKTLALRLYQFIITKFPTDSALKQLAASYDAGSFAQRLVKVSQLQLWLPAATKSGEYTSVHTVASLCLDARIIALVPRIFALLPDNDGIKGIEFSSIFLKLTFSLRFDGLQYFSPSEVEELKKLHIDGIALEHPPIQRMALLKPIYNFFSQQKLQEVVTLVQLLCGPYWSHWNSGMYEFDFIDRQNFLAKRES